LGVQWLLLHGQEEQDLLGQGLQEEQLLLLAVEGLLHEEEDPPLQEEGDFQRPGDWEVQDL